MGRVQSEHEPVTARLLISNGVVLFAVAAVLTAKAWLAAVALMAGYLALLWFERGAEILPDWYATMRRNLTLGVALAHGLFAQQSLQTLAGLPLTLGDLRHVPTAIDLYSTRLDFFQGSVILRRRIRNALQATSASA